VGKAKRAHVLPLWSLSFQGEEAMKKIALSIAIAFITTTPVIAFRGASEINWTHQLSHHIPAWELHCVFETFAKEGFDTELLETFKVKQDDPQVQAIRKYCQNHQPVVPGLWPAVGERLKKSHPSVHGRRHVKHRRR
jgi:hypothetical protein